MRGRLNARYSVKRCRHNRGGRVVACRFGAINKARVLMQQKTQTCSVSIYNEETNKISTFNIPVNDIAATLAKHTSFDVPLDDFDNRVDDDFARRLGGMVLLTLASGSKFLKDHISIRTEHDPYTHD
jgi:hypothetical protein